MALSAAGEAATVVGRAAWWLGEQTFGASPSARGFQAFTATAAATSAVVDAVEKAAFANMSGRTRQGTRFTPNPRDERSTQRDRIRAQNEATEPTHRRISTGRQVVPIPPAPPNSPELTRQNAMNGTGGNTDEVPLVPAPKRIGKIVQDYTTIVLPFWQLFNISDSQIAGTNSVDIRLNSIYDPVVGSSTNRQPQGRDAFAQNYQYYRVIRSSVDVEWMSNKPAFSELNLSSNSGTLRPGQSTYVVGWETQNGETGALSNTVDAFMMTKHAKRQILYPAAGNTNDVEITGIPVRSFQSVGESYATVSYNYEPQAFIHETGHVQNQNKSEFWTPVGENPEHRHVLSLRTFPLDGTTDLMDNSMRMQIYITYVVQFREYAYSAIKQLDTGDATYATGEGKLDTITGA